MSSLALSALEKEFNIPNLAGILAATGSYVFGLLPAIAAAIPENLAIFTRDKQEILPIVVKSKQHGLVLVGYLTALDYLSSTHGLIKQLMDDPWPEDGWQARRCGDYITKIVIFIEEQLTPPFLSADAIKMPTCDLNTDNLLMRRITWLMKPEEALTEDDRNDIEAYKEAGFIVLSHEPERL